MNFSKIQFSLLRSEARPCYHCEIAFCFYSAMKIVLDEKSNGEIK